MTLRNGATARERDARHAAVRADRGARLLSLGGIAGGLAAASCCLVPFLLFLAGITGAWIGDLTALEPYRLYFAGFAAVCIGYGSYRVYRRSADDCADDTFCARPESDRIAKIALWTASAVVVIAIVSPDLIAYWF